MSAEKTIFDNITCHKQICGKLNKIYEEKNHDYGDSFSKTRKIVPYAILVRLHDKLGRLDTLMMAPDSVKFKEESIDDALLDLANYAIMELVERCRDVEIEASKTEEQDLTVFVDPGTGTQTIHAFVPHKSDNS